MAKQPKTIQVGQIIRADWLNGVRDAALTGGNISGVPPISVIKTPTGIQIKFDEFKPTVKWAVIDAESDVCLSDNFAYMMPCRSDGSYTASSDNRLIVYFTAVTDTYMSDLVISDTNLKSTGEIYQTLWPYEPTSRGVGYSYEEMKAGFHGEKIRISDLRVSDIKLQYRLVKDSYHYGTLITSSDMDWSTWHTGSDCPD